MNLRGVGLHEDDPATGFAIDSARRAQIVAQAKELGATVIRSHYPLHPDIHELADRAGLLIWSEIPVYAVKTQYLKREEVRKLAAKELAAEHPRQPEPPVDHAVVDRQRAVGAARARCRRCYIRARGRATPRRSIRRGPVGLAVAGYPVGRLPAAVRAARRHRHQRVLRLVSGPQRPDRRPRHAARTTSTPSAPAIRSKAIIVSEFGAEANRDGPGRGEGHVRSTSRTS